MTAALEGGEWSAARPGRNLPPGKTRYPFYRRLGGPQGRSEWAENLFPTGIRSRTVQPVTQSLYQLSYPGHYIYIYIYVTALLFSAPLLFTLADLITKTRHYKTRHYKTYSILWSVCMVTGAVKRDVCVLHWSFFFVCVFWFLPPFFKFNYARKL